MAIANSFSIYQCSMFNVQCSMFNVQCSMFNVQCSMFNEWRESSSIWIFYLSLLYFRQRLGKGYATGDTLVGNDVWIGYKSTIMPGVTIVMSF